MRLVIAAIVFGLACLAAHADSFSFTLSSNGMTGSGQLTGLIDPYNANAFDLTSGSGVFGGDQINLYTPSGTTQKAILTSGSVPYSYNNVLYTSGNSLDVHGLLFSIVGTPTVLNVYYSGTPVISGGSLNSLNWVSPASFRYDVVATDVVATPEPSSIVLLGTGLLTAATFFRKRFAL